MPADERRRVRENFRRFKQLSPDRRRELRDRFRDMTPEQRQRLRDRMQKGTYRQGQSQRLVTDQFHAANVAPMLLEYVGPDGGAYENWCTQRDSSG